MRPSRSKTRIQEMSRDEWVEVCKTHTLNEIVRGLNCSSSTIYTVAKNHDFYPYMKCAHKRCGLQPRDAFNSKNDRKCSKHSGAPRQKYAGEEGEYDMCDYAYKPWFDTNATLRSRYVQGAW